MLLGNVMAKGIHPGTQPLGVHFGSGGSPTCLCLTLEEVRALDWEQVDFCGVHVENVVCVYIMYIYFMINTKHWCLGPYVWAGGKG